MKITFKHFWLTTLAICSCGAHADSIHTWGNVSNVTSMAVPLLAGVATLANNDLQGSKELLLSTGSAVLAAELLKLGIHSNRPDGSDKKSFPSAHTTLAFSAAAFLDRRYGEQYTATWTPALYGLAVLTGVARVEAKKHHWVDVVAGGGLGYASASYWTEPVHGGRMSLVPLQGGLMLRWARAL